MIAARALLSAPVLALVSPLAVRAQDAPHRNALERIDLSGAPGIKVITSSDIALNSFALHGFGKGRPLIDVAT